MHTARRGGLGAGAPYVTSIRGYTVLQASPRVKPFHVLPHYNITRRRIFLYRSAQTTCLGLNGLVDPSDNHFLLYSCWSVLQFTLERSVVLLPPHHSCGFRCSLRKLMSSAGAGVSEGNKFVVRKEFTGVYVEEYCVMARFRFGLSQPVEQRPFII